MKHSKLALLGLAVSSLAIASCADDNNRYRVASVGASAVGSDDNNSNSNSSGDSASGGGSGVGNGGNGGTSGGTGGSGSSGSGNILVAGGNVLVGAASQYAALTGSTNGLVPLGGTVNGTVTAVLGNSGHTLIELGSGTSLLVNGTGGKLGDVLALNLGTGQVVGGPNGSPLIGANVLAANPVSGSLATVSAASGNQLVGVTVLDSALGGRGGGGGNNVVIAPAVAPALGLNGSVTNTVNATVGGILGR